MTQIIRINPANKAVEIKLTDGHKIRIVYGFSILMIMRVGFLNWGCEKIWEYSWENLDREVGNILLGPYGSKGLVNSFTNERRDQVSSVIDKCTRAILSCNTIHDVRNIFQDYDFLCKIYEDIVREK